MPVKTSIIDPAPSKFSQNSVCPKLSKQLIIQQTLKVTLHYVALNFVRIENVVPCLSFLSSGHCDSFRKESHKKIMVRQGDTFDLKIRLDFTYLGHQKGHFHPFLTLCCFGYLAVFGWVTITKRRCIFNHFTIKKLFWVSMKHNERENHNKNSNNKTTATIK